MKKAWKKDEGVSPVIATILMVAITVVLAAVLYVMVVGIGPGPDITKAGAWTEVKAMSKTSGRAVFGSFSVDMTPLSLQIFVKANNTEAGSITWANNTDPSKVTWTGSPIGAAVTYHDYQPTQGQINAGDYLELTGLKPGTTYSFELLNVESGDLISMSGARGQFTTPA